MKVLAWANGSGSQFWRLEDPFKYLNQMGHECYVTRKNIPLAFKQGLLDWADILIPQGIVDKEGLAVIYMYQQEKGKKIIVDQDDRLEVSKDNPHYEDHRISDAITVVGKSLEIADLVTTTNDYLAKKLRQYNPNLTILPNYVDLERWELPSKSKHTGMVRLGWCGSVTHLKDLELIEKPLKRILTEFAGKVELTLVGDPRYRLMFQDFRNVEVMLGVPFEAWPSKLSGLCIDIGLAPLVDNDFNRCKSPIKFYEYAINHTPSVVSSTVYGDQICRELDGKLAMVADTPEQWYQSIKNLIVCPELRQDIANSAYAYVKSKRSLVKQAYKWEQAYKKVLT